MSLCYPSYDVIHLLGLAKRVKARFLLASTSEVYGGKKAVIFVSKFSGVLSHRSRGVGRHQAVIATVVVYLLPVGSPSNGIILGSC